MTLLDGDVQVVGSGRLRPGFWELLWLIHWVREGWPASAR